MQVLYNLFILIFSLLLKVLTTVSSKVKKGVEGRKESFSIIKSNLSKKDKVIWIHTASLGEFEQGRPVIENLKEKYPEYKIALSFFSPSGYEVRKNYKGADAVFYLPFDSKKNMRELVEMLCPSLFILVKYEYWYNLLSELNRKKVPMALVSGIFREKQLFFKPYGKWFLNKLKYIDYFFVQNESSVKLLQSKGIDAMYTGDTRFDRVKELVCEKVDFPLIESFKKGSEYLVVIGSSWKEDQDKFLPMIRSEKFSQVKWLFAPHEIQKEKIELFENSLRVDTVKYSQLESIDEDSLIKAKVLILDTIGMLSKVYKYADLAYIGGAFGKGLHNTLEAATYGIPVVFGPKYHKFQEAIDLIEKGAAFSVSSSKELEEVLNKILTDTGVRETMGESSKNYVHGKPSATAIIISELEGVLKTT